MGHENTKKERPSASGTTESQTHKNNGKEIRKWIYQAIQLVQRNSRADQVGTDSSDFFTESQMCLISYTKADLHTEKGQAVSCLAAGAQHTGTGVGSPLLLWGSGCCLGLRDSRARTRPSPAMLIWGSHSFFTTPQFLLHFRRLCWVVRNVVQCPCVITKQPLTLEREKMRSRLWTMQEMMADWSWTQSCN